MLMVAGNGSKNSQITQHIAASSPGRGLHSAFFQRQYKVTAPATDDGRAGQVTRLAVVMIAAALYLGATVPVKAPAVGLPSMLLFW